MRTAAERSLLSAFAALMAVLVGTAACDSGDPFDRVSCGSVAGTYGATVFTFDPDADYFPVIDLLDTLDASNTQLRLLNSCDFVLTYAFRDQLTTLITGDFDVSADEVRLDGGKDSPGLLSPIYLSNPLSFRRLEAATMQVEQVQVVNLSTISSEFEGVPPVRGTIRLQVSQGSDAGLVP